MIMRTIAKETLLQKKEKNIFACGLKNSKSQSK